MIRTLEENVISFVCDSYEFMHMQTMAGGYMVAFAGRQYAARSVPVFVADNTNTITSFTLVTFNLLLC